MRPLFRSKHHVLFLAGEVCEQRNAPPLPIDAGYSSDTTRVAGVTLVARIAAEFGKGTGCIKRGIMFELSRSIFASQALVEHRSRATFVHGDAPAPGVSNRRRHFPAPEGFFQMRHQRQRDILAPRPRGYLNA